MAEESRSVLYSLYIIIRHLSKLYMGMICTCTSLLSWANGFYHVWKWSSQEKTILATLSDHEGDTFKPKLIHCF